MEKTKHRIIEAISELDAELAGAESPVANKVRSKLLSALHIIAEGEAEAAKLIPPTPSVRSAPQPQP